MGKKSDDDKGIEDRIRAYIRQRMIGRRLGVTAAAEVLGADQGNLTRILNGERGISAGLAFRVSARFDIDLERLFHVDPPQIFWRYYVPRPPRDPDDAAPSPARPARRESKVAEPQPVPATKVKGR